MYPADKLLNVVFDYTIYGQWISIATLVFRNQISEVPDYKKVVCRPIDNPKQYHAVLMALESAGKYVVELLAEDLKNESRKGMMVAICHQNLTMIEWVKKQASNKENLLQFEKALIPWTAIADKVSIGVVKIDKKENGAKRYCIKPDNVPTRTVQTLNWKVTQTVDLQDSNGNNLSNSDSEAEELKATGTDNVIRLSDRQQRAVDALEEFGPRV